MIPMRSLTAAELPEIPATALTAVLAALVMTAVMISLSACRPMAMIADGSLRQAAATGAAGELQHLGVHPQGALTCSTPSSNTRSVVRVECAGRTAQGQRIQVSGVVHDADSRRPREWYVITVDGRDVLEKGCLGQGCGHPSAIRH